MTHHDAKTIAADAIRAAAPSEAEADQLIASPRFEEIVTSLINAVTVADPKADDSQAAADAAETWVCNFNLQP